ncbi:MAG: presenilin family intramembrane aspartyl protease [Candidatus Aenigmarchaeota archaeon]|nr:presenilin family intramembrane aspartyl protease [Candidatus Aenigmarchaeota archaeon]
MKHTIPVTLIIILIFFLSQVIGLYALSYTIKGIGYTPEGEVVVEYADTAIGERPQLYDMGMFLYMIAAILIGTGLILLLVKFKKFKIWKAMFFFAVWMTCSVTLGVFVDPIIAFSVSIFLAFFKIFKPNMIIHNVSELLIYPGIAIIFVPNLNIFWVTLLLLVISVYDVFAVWKSKHMVSMAQFQTKSRAFAGVFVTYKLKAKKGLSKAARTVKGKKTAKTAKKEVASVEYRNAILGGGDIAFPLIFAGVVMDSLIKMSVAKTTAFAYALIIPVVVAIALFSLLAFAKKDRFYPAMPFITAGCLAGYGILWLLGSGIIA